MQIQSLKPYVTRIVVIVVLAALIGLGWRFQDRWIPVVDAWVPLKPPGAKGETHDAHDASGHAAHAGHNEMDSLELTDQARRNIGLTDDKLPPIRLQTFTRMLDVPARIVERPGRTHIRIPSPLTGIVTAVFAVQGEAVTPGTVLFRVRLTHEDLVQAQSEFLKTLGELDVENKEIARLEGLDKQGIIAGKTLLARQYEKQKLVASLKAQREALRLHGLSSEQIDTIEKTGSLLSELVVTAPALHAKDTKADRQGYAIRPASAVEDGVGDAAVSRDVFTVQRVTVQTGALVNAGEPLCILADLTSLYVEGRGFEQDADELATAARESWPVAIVPENQSDQLQPVEGLKIVYLDNEVDAESRALRFYVELPNQVVQSTQSQDGHRFITWKFRPGQRMQLRVPIEQWTERIVLPVDAVAQEGAEYYVFQQNGDHFDRRPVQVEYQDQYSVVIANDGSIFPGDVVATTGAHQLQMALKNKAGGGVDPHAGHNH